MGWTVRIEHTMCPNRNWDGDKKQHVCSQTGMKCEFTTCPRKNSTGIGCGSSNTKFHLEK